MSTETFDALLTDLCSAAQQFAAHRWTDKERAREWLATQNEKCRELFALYEAAMADAERYRWLRERHDNLEDFDSLWHVRDQHAHPIAVGQLDAAIDNAIDAAQRQEQEGNNG